METKKTSETFKTWPPERNDPMTTVRCMLLVIRSLALRPSAVATDSTPPRTDTDDEAITVTAGAEGLNVINGDPCAVTPRSGYHNYGKATSAGTASTRRR